MNTHMYYNLESPFFSVLILTILPSWKRPNGRDDDGSVTRENISRSIVQTKIYIFWYQ